MGTAREKKALSVHCLLVEKRLIKFSVWEKSSFQRLFFLTSKACHTTTLKQRSNPLK